MPRIPRTNSPDLRERSGRPPAVVLGGLANALSVARSLGRAGVPVYVLAEGPRPSPACRSRFVRGFVVGSGRWDEWFAASRSGGVVLPCSDEAIEYIAAKRSWLAEGGFVATEGDDQAALAVLDKARTYDIARAARIPAPRTSRAGDAASVVGAMAELGLPCAIKPVHSHHFTRLFPGKGLVVSSLDDLHMGLRTLAEAGVDAILTEIIPGGEDSYCSYYAWMDERGEPLFHFTKRKLRQFPAGFGIGTYHETAWVPDAAELGLQFFRAAGLRGLCNVEFKRDERDGTLKLIECNPRFTAANELILRAGMDFALLAYERALGRPGPVFDGFRQGLHQWHPVEDVRALVQYRRSGDLTIAAWAASLAHRQVLPYWRLDDPRPTLANAVAFGARVVRRLARR